MALPEVLIIGEQHAEQSFLNKFPHKEVKKTIRGVAVNVAVFDIERIEKEGKAIAFLEAAKQATRITTREIEEIKKFGGKKFLYEMPSFGGFAAATSRLRDKSGLERFQEELLAAHGLFTTEIIKEAARVAQNFKPKHITVKIPLTNAVTPHLPKNLSFIMESTEIYNIRFIDNRNFVLRFAAYSAVWRGINDKLSELKASERELKDEQREKYEEVKESLEAIKGALKPTLEKAIKEREIRMIENIKTELIDGAVVICGARHAPVIANSLKNVANVTGPVIIRETEEEDEGY